MAETYRELAAGFSTADAENPSLDYRNGDLVLCFCNWRDEQVAVRFPNTIAFHWQEEAILPDSVRNDQSYEVVRSSWLVDLTDLGAADTRHRHYKLCFNVAGVLDVVSDLLQVLPDCVP